MVAGEEQRIIFEHDAKVSPVQADALLLTTAKTVQAGQSG